MEIETQFQFWFENQFQKLNLTPVWFLLTGTRDFNWPNGVLLAQQWLKPVFCPVSRHAPGFNMNINIGY
jgi:hypothetical protein